MTRNRQTVQGLTSLKLAVGGGVNDTRYPAIAALVATAPLLVGLGAAAWVGQTPGSELEAAAIALGALLLAALAFFSIKMCDQWEKAVVLRLGAYRGLRGPGLFFIVPFVDRIAYHIDQRIRANDFAAESCLTKDTVPVNVDAIAFWLVWDAEKAALEVQSFYEAVTLSAQTALRDSIGKHDLADLVTSRQELGDHLQAVLDQKMHDWGVTVQSVEIRDVVIPTELEDAMSRQAQAERERQSRIILGTAETEIAEKFVTAAKSYQQNPAALNLRAMNMLYESMIKRGSLMVVPSTIADSLNVGGVAGLAAMAGTTVPRAAGESADG